MAKLTRDDSLLLKSAEALGRMIGTLQRQLDTASRRLPPETVTVQAATRKRKPAARKAAKKKSTARKGVARKTARPR